MKQGVFIKQSFTSEQTKRLEESSGPSQYITDWLSDDEFSLLRSIALDPKITYPEIGRVSKYWGFGPEHEPARNISPWLLPKLDQLLGSYKIAFLAFQEAIQPWQIHADIKWNETEVPYKVLLVPLDVEPITGPVSSDQWPDTNTITFNQRNFLRQLPDSEGEVTKLNTGQGHWLRPYDDPCVEGLIPGYHISTELWSRYLSHIDYSYAEGLTIDKINTWKPKSMMYWDHNALHTADDFPGHGIRTKRCFMIFTYLL